MLLEITYMNHSGSVCKPCPFGEKVKLYNSLTSNKPCGERVRTVGASDCTACPYYAGFGKVVGKAGTSTIETRLCRHPADPKKLGADIKLIDR